MPVIFSNDARYNRLYITCFFKIYICNDIDTLTSGIVFPYRYGLFINFILYTFQDFFGIFQYGLNKPIILHHPIYMAGFLPNSELMGKYFSKLINSSGALPLHPYIDCQSSPIAIIEGAIPL